ncbi:MAG: ATP-binding protein [Elusimicrobiota bacterium]|jgi:hypothetical protein|nr:ATP-binding protein [Elusimicrobiota bacterium]
MYFNKPVSQLTFEDVIEFLKKGVAENTMLDYKLMLPRDNEKFAKTIAAFANSMGGTVIIGVKDGHDKPLPPFTGIPFHSKIRGQIESIIQDNIDPVVFVDIATCKDPYSNNMFVVVNIPQSSLTPHLVGRMKRAYIRTGQASRPEIIVHPEKLPWLLDNRRKSQNLRHILTDKAEAHFNNYLRAKFKNPEGAQAAASLLLTPLYPQTPAADYKNLPLLLELIKFDCGGGDYPPQHDYKTVQDGIVAPLDENSALELNCYGLMLYKTAMADGEHYINPRAFYENMLLFFKAAANFYNAIGLISPLMLRLKLSNARGVKIKTQQGDKQLIEDYIRIDKNLQPGEIQGDLAALAAPLMEEFAWAIGLPFEAGQSARLIEETLARCGNNDKI